LIMSSQSPHSTGKTQILYLGMDAGTLLENP
jgi:hypothetical protein